MKALVLAGLVLTISDHARTARHQMAYALDVGDAPPCSESGDRDWYLEARGLVGKDFIAHAWGLSPHSGLGVRHGSNGLLGAYEPVNHTNEFFVGLGFHFKGMAMRAVGS